MHMGGHRNATSNSGLATAQYTSARGAVHLGQVQRLSPAEVSIRFPDGCNIPLGVEVQVRFSVAGRGTTQPLPLRPLRRADAGLGQEYHFTHSIDPDQLPDFLRPNVDRRQVKRHAMVRPVPAQLEALGVPAVVGTLRDISSHGCALVLDPQVEQRFAFVEDIRIAFRFGPDLGFAFPASIRRRMLDRSGQLTYGIQFRIEDEAGARGQQVLAESIQSLPPAN